MRPKVDSFRYPRRHPNDSLRRSFLATAAITNRGADDVKRKTLGLPFSFAGVANVLITFVPLRKKNKTNTQDVPAATLIGAATFSAFQLEEIIQSMASVSIEPTSLVD